MHGVGWGWGRGGGRGGAAAAFEGACQPSRSVEEAICAWGDEDAWVEPRGRTKLLFEAFSKRSLYRSEKA